VRAAIVQTTQSGKLQLSVFAEKSASRMTNKSFWQAHFDKRELLALSL
jgi:hypothetical protein